MGSSHDCTGAELQVSEVSQTHTGFRGSVRIYVSDQCPRQDSNLRSRLRRAWHHLPLTSGNVLTGDPSGYVLGTGRITAGHGLVSVNGVSRAGAATAGYALPCTSLEQPSGIVFSAW